MLSIGINKVQNKQGILYSTSMQKVKYCICNVLLQKLLKHSYVEAVSLVTNRTATQLVCLTLSQTSPGFYVSVVNFFQKYCGKRRNCS